MIILVTFLFLASTCYARPGINAVPQNVVTVPPNCPEGQEWVNEECRDIWRVTAAPANVVSVPPNCPPGQEYVNGQCREIWFKIFRELNSLGEVQLNNEDVEFVPQNVVSVPNNCKPGQQWVNGYCRDVWRSGSNTKNVISVPTNCPDGQQYVNGQCREVWRRSPNLIQNYIKNILDRKLRQAESLDVVPDQYDPNRNVISVPNQCPAGYKPDALGICREIFNIDN